MNLKINVKIDDANKIIKKHGLDDDGDVTEFARGTVDRFMDEYIPYAAGSGTHLKELKQYPDKKTIKYVSPYSHYHFKGELMLAPNGSSFAKEGEKKHYTGISMKYQGAPKRGPEWDKRMMNDRKNEVCRDVQNFIDNGGV